MVKFNRVNLSEKSNLLSDIGHIYGLALRCLSLLGTRIYIRGREKTKDLKALPI